MIKKISKDTYRKFTDKEMELFFYDSFGNKDGKNIYQFYSSKEKSFFFAETQGKKIIGTIFLSIYGNVARIGAFIVTKEHRRTGVGSELLGKCEQVAREHKCKKIWLWTLPNIKAYNFYKKMNFIEEARLKNHWANKDLCAMSKFL